MISDDAYLEAAIDAYVEHLVRLAWHAAKHRAGL